MNINLEQCISASFKNKYWKEYMLINSAICYLPILLSLLASCFHLDMLKSHLWPFVCFCCFLFFIPMGFIFNSVHLRLNNISQENLSFKEDFAKSFKFGLFLFIINFLYTFFICFILTAVIFYFAANDYISISDIQSPLFFFQNEVIAPFFALLFILFLFVFVLIPYFSIAYAEDLNLLDAFNWVKIFKRLCESFKSFLLCVVCSLLITLFIILSMMSLLISTNSCLYFCLKIMSSFSLIISPFYWGIIFILVSAVIFIPFSILLFCGNLIIYNLMAQVYKKR